MTEQLLQLTRAMAEAAEQDAWDRVESLQLQRDALLKSLPADAAEFRDRELITQLYQFNERCLSLALQHRQARVQGELQERRQLAGVQRYLELGA